jgi:hypothetical protein
VTISVASIPKELELKDTTDPVRSTWYLDLLFEMTLLSSMTNMMTFYSVLSISRWFVVTLHPLLKASPQKFYGRHTESVDKYGVSISTGAPGPCSLFWRSPSCSFTFSFMCIFFLFHMCFSLYLSPFSLLRICPLTHEIWISL